MNKTYNNTYIAKGSKLNIDEASYKSGDHAEKLVAQYFKNKGATVTDTSDDKAMQKQDVDMIIEKDNKQVKVEVKYDSYAKRTEALCFELRDLTWNTRSWFYTSKADLLVVVPQGAEYMAYAIRFEDLRKIPESAMNLRKQKDPQSGHWFEVGIIDIYKIEEMGITVNTLPLPKNYIDDEGYSYKYIEEVRAMIGIWSLKEIEELGYKIPKALLN